MGGSWAAPFEEGESISFIGPNAGGYGDVLERDPQMVMQDLRKGIISNWTAQRVYHVVYDGKTLQVDNEKTKESREAERADRKKRGRPYSEFEKEWLKKKPNPEILKYYGTWPDPEVGLKENPLTLIGG